MWRFPRFLRWRKTFLTLLVLVLLLVAARAAAPTFVQRYVNDTLDRVPDYDGHIGDVDLHLWRGAYSIENIDIVKTTGDVPVPLYSATRVDLSIDWSSLFHGAVVGEIVMIEPKINMVDQDPEEGGDQTGAGRPWIAVIEDLFPFRIDRLEIIDGELHLWAFDTEPAMNVYLKRVHAVAENLTNSREISDTLAATIRADGLAMDHAVTKVELQLDPSSEKPTFDVDAEIRNLDVVTLSPMTKKYAALDVERGWFDLFVEIKAVDGQMTGYATPMFTDLVVFNFAEDVGEDKDNPLQLAWEGFMGLVTELLENQPRDQLATRVPLDGDIANPDTDLLAIIGGVLRHAFLKAFVPRLEHSVGEKQPEDV